MFSVCPFYFFFLLFAHFTFLLSQPKGIPKTDEEEVRRLSTKTVHRARPTPRKDHYVSNCGRERGQRGVRIQTQKNFIIHNKCIK